MYMDKFWQAAVSLGVEGRQLLPELLFALIIFSKLNKIKTLLLQSGLYEKFENIGER